MQTRKLLTVVTLVIALVLAGCAPSKTPGSSLEGTTWVLTSLKAGPALATTTVTIEFSNGRISGSDGCNSYSGSVTLKGNQFRVGNDIISTMMACLDPIMQQSTAFYEALKQSTTYKVAGQQLMLLDASGQTLATFARQTGQPGETPASAAPATVAPQTVAPATATTAAVAAVTQTPPEASSIAQALPNANYPLEGTSTGKAQLKGGLFEEPAAPGSASMIRVQLGVQQAFGDVNGDGTQDAAVTLVVDPGGSGTFTYLAVVLNDRGAARPVASVLLGDRIVVESVTIQSGSVVVIMLTRTADQPMSATPTTEVTRTFQLRADQLLEVVNQ